MNVLREWLGMYGYGDKVYNKIIETKYISKMPQEIFETLYPIIGDTVFISEEYIIKINNIWESRDLLKSYYKIQQNFRNLKSPILITINQDETDDNLRAIVVGDEGQSILKELIIPTVSINNITFSKIGIYYREFLKSIKSWEILLGYSYSDKISNPHFLFIQDEFLPDHIRKVYKNFGMLIGNYIINRSIVYIQILDSVFTLIPNVYILSDNENSDTIYNNIKVINKYDYISISDTIKIDNVKHILKIKNNTGLLLKVLDIINTESMDTDINSFVEKSILKWG